MGKLGTFSRQWEQKRAEVGGCHYALGNKRGLPGSWAEWCLVIGARLSLDN
jgi:hypothetical protein